MSVPAERLAEAPAPNRGLSIWWTPARLAVHDGTQWRTFVRPRYEHMASLARSQTVAVSPIGEDSCARYVAWDIDHGGREAMQKLVGSLPPGCVPLVSKSGGRNGEGFHVWLFPSEPVAVEAAVAFAMAVREKAAVACEIFPSGRQSRCLKWPGQKHPETGETEEFLDPETGEAFDTPMVLEMLAEGYYRTPAAVIEGYANRRELSRLYANYRNSTRTTPERLLDGTKVVQSLEDVAKQEELTHELMRLAGRRPVRLGEAFRCILPGHEERHSSAAWYRQPDGCICYHDFHQRDGEEWYTLGEVAYALTTGKVEKLGPTDRARWLADLGLRCGFATSVVLRQRERLQAVGRVLSQLLSPHVPQLAKRPRLPTNHHYISGWLQGQPSNGSCTWADAIERAWAAIAEEAEIQAFGGFEEIALSKRFLASRARLSPEVANRAANLLCTLGLLEKVPASGGMRGDRFTVPDEADLEEASFRLEALFPDGQVDLRRFNRVLSRPGSERASLLGSSGVQRRHIRFGEAKHVLERLLRHVLKQLLACWQRFGNRSGTVR